MWYNKNMRWTITKLAQITAVETEIGFARKSIFMTSMIDGISAS